MKKYLTEDEIKYFNRVKNNNINYGDINRIKEYFKKIGGEHSTDLTKNLNFIWNYNFQKNKVGITEGKWYHKFKNDFPNRNFGDWEKGLFSHYFKEIEPDGFKYYELCSKNDLTEKKQTIKEYLTKNTDITDFPFDEFLLNQNYDLFEYTEEAENEKRKDEIKDVEQVVKSVLYFFELITKGLNDEQRELLKDNLFVKIQYIIDNISLEDLKTKGDKFRNMLNYFSDEKGIKN